MTSHLSDELQVACTTGKAACESVGLRFWSTGAVSGNYWAVDGNGKYFNVAPVTKSGHRTGWIAWPVDKNGVQVGETIRSHDPEPIARPTEEVEEVGLF